MIRIANIALLLPLSLAAANLSGIWVGQFPGRNGEVRDIAFKFTQNGTSLTGKLYGDYISFPLQDGKVAGDLIIFLVTTSEQAGNQINETRVRFSGRVVGDEVELVRDREGATNAGNSGSAQFRENTKQSFRLKRLD